MFVLYFLFKTFKNYSLTTFAFVLPFYSDSGQIEPINALIILALKMANSKAKPESIKLLSLNVRGLSNFHNGRAIFSWCRKRKAELVLFLQETHSITERRGAQVLFSRGNKNARVVAILIKNSLDITIPRVK